MEPLTEPVEEGDDQNASQGTSHPPVAADEIEDAPVLGDDDDEADS